MRGAQHLSANRIRSNVVLRLHHAIVTLGLVSLAILSACTSGDEQRTPSVVGAWRQIGSWSGRGNAQLETCPVGGGRLRITWEARNESAPGQGQFRLHLHSADSGRILAEVADHAGAGSGASEISDEHQRFYLSVDSTDVEWTVRVEEAASLHRESHLVRPGAFPGGVAREYADGDRALDDPRHVQHGQRPHRCVEGDDLPERVGHRAA